ncbi:MAG: hypothetical protein AB7P17_00450 [Nitrospirales bacterium]|nr:hypothetical protein [Nitrospirales bacterium]
MMFVDQTYIDTALRSETAYHERKVEQLQRTIKRLTDALTWEKLQHRSRLTELENVASQIAPMPTKNVPLTKNPLTRKTLKSSTKKWSQTRKHQSHTSDPTLIPKAG